MLRLGILLKVNGYTLKGNNSVIFIVACHIPLGHLIKERICSSRSKFFPLRVDPILGRLRPIGNREPIGSRNLVTSKCVGKPGTII